MYNIIASEKGILGNTVDLYIYSALNILSYGLIAITPEKALLIS